MDDNSLARSRYNCTYHIVFIPKYRRKVMFGSLRKEVGEILGKICKMEEEYDKEDDEEAYDDDEEETT